METSFNSRTTVQSTHWSIEMSAWHFLLALAIFTFHFTTSWLHFFFFSSLDPELKEAKEGTERLIHSLSPGVVLRKEENKEEQEAILSPFRGHILVSNNMLINISKLYGFSYNKGSYFKLQILNYFIFPPFTS